MGAVYLARDQQLKRTVALKLLTPDSLDDAETFSRFATEARAIGALGHPHIGTLLDFHAEADPAPFLVLEYIDGESLRALLVREQRLSVPRAVHIAQQMLSALSAVHALGTIHRDIKPANVMLVNTPSAPDFVRIVDFGIARVAASVTRAHQTADGAILGTPQYMPPEQAAGLPPHPGIDVYAVALCLFEMLAGYNPFALGSAMLVFAAVRDVVPPALYLLRPDVPRALSDVVARALGKLPSTRFSTAQELSMALAATSSPVSAGPVSPSSDALAFHGSQRPPSDPTLSARHSQHPSSPSLAPATSAPTLAPSLPPTLSGGARHTAPPAQMHQAPPLHVTPPGATENWKIWVAVGVVVPFLMVVIAAVALFSFGAAGAFLVARDAAGSKDTPARPPAKTAEPPRPAEVEPAVEPPTAPTAAVVSTPATPPATTKAASAAKPGSSAPKPAGDAVPDRLGTCTCGFNSQVALCGTRSTVMCKCMSPRLGPLCLDRKGVQCFVFDAPGMADGEACSGTSGDGRATQGTGKWVCRSCDPADGTYRGTDGATCSGFHPATQAPQTGRLRCRK